MAHYKAIADAAHEADLGMDLIYRALELGAERRAERERERAEKLRQDRSKGMRDDAL